MANLIDGDQSFCNATQSGGTTTATGATTAVTTPSATSAGNNTPAGGGVAPPASHTCSGSVWAEFCERHARAASADFARSCVHYVTNNLPESVQQTVSHRDFMRRFIECFQEHFEHDFYRRRIQSKTGNGAAMVLEESDYSEDTDSPKTNHKPFFRRLSFKGLRKGKALFHKQHSDEVELSGSRSNKTKLAKIVVECRKEGTVNYLTPESLEQPSNSHKWEKCKLLLVKTVGGYMLEFYSPPKSQKPRSGVFCFLITEARETTALEMPDHENTFVLKADNNMEYVIEARDTDDMRSWLATIRYCMRSTSTSQLPPTSDLNVTMNTSISHGGGGGGGGPGGGTTNTAGLSGTLANDVNNLSLNQSALNAVPTMMAPELPPRRLDDRISSSSNFELTEGDLEQTHETDTDLTAMMREYPWFHGTLARSEAAQLVLHNGISSHGVFLVRQSETRKGEFVLTFNFQGKAKHLRMTLNDLGQCRVQHLWFPSITEMLEHFRQHPIPLESGGTADVTLTNFVVLPSHAMAATTQSNSNNYSTTTIGGSGAGGGGGTGAAGAGSGIGTNANPNTSPRHPLHVITMNGSVRIKTCDLELSQQTIHTHEMPTVGQSGGATSGVTGGQVSSGGQPGTSPAVGDDGQRAVDNQYSYV
ncbi:SH2B adapter protein 2 isoform X2 [Toxorhynchites rutilus septentrionalis]|uniref:SH2B adapter protein 2 isoform X2 n=1 Tax=Toxorhynchites rutilus septentrionalis TaxID=329112 RepID=UPI002478E7E6|nr:SH2B adapter protein 2 isoform X2 [Toxorhynchites rutilus septentrionalis]